MRSLWISLWVVCLAISLHAFDLDSVRKESNPEKRSDLALANAQTALDAARSASQTGNLDGTQTALSEVSASIELVDVSLEESGKDAGRNPKYFKRAELSLRQMLRELKGLAESLSLEDRSIAEKVHDQVSSLHDKLLTGIMSKKKK
jgi:hypothetical protein